MNPKQRPKEIIYLIEWQDAHSSSGWHSNHELDDFIKQEKCICMNVGWILSETKDEIVLASRRLKWREKAIDPEWGSLQKIPKAWIRKKVIFNKMMIAH